MLTPGKKTITSSRNCAGRAAICGGVSTVTGAGPSFRSTGPRYGVTTISALTGGTVWAVPGSFVCAFGEADGVSAHAGETAKPEADMRNSVTDRQTRACF